MKTNRAEQYSEVQEEEGTLKKASGICTVLVAKKNRYTKNDKILPA